MSKLQREILTTTIDNNEVKYKIVSLLQIFELINILEEAFYTKNDLTKVQSLTYDKRLEKLKSIFEEYSSKDKSVEADMRLLMNRESRKKIIELLESFYIDININDVDSKLFLQLYSYVVQKVFSSDVQKMLE